MRFITFFFLLLLGIVNIFLFKYFFFIGIENGFSWTFSSFFGWFICLISITLSSLLISYSGLKKSLKISCIFLLIGGIVIFTFIKNPIYSSDYNKTGIEHKFKKHSIANQLNKELDKEFDGFVLLARSGCPYCDIAIQDILVPLKKRNPHLDVAVFQVIGSDESLVQYKKKNTKEILFTTKKIKLPKNEILSIRGFPTYLYVKNGTILHQWSNNELGFRSLDWIEQGLN